MHPTLKAIVTEMRFLIEALFKVINYEMCYWKNFDHYCRVKRYISSIIGGSLIVRTINFSLLFRLETYKSYTVLAVYIGHILLAQFYVIVNYSELFKLLLRK